MDRSRRSSLAQQVLALAAGLALAAIAPAADPPQNDRDAPRVARHEVELFAGIQQKQLEVQLIPRDSSQGRLLISNKTDQPLSVKLPDAFAGVPVLAQFGAFGGNLPPGLMPGGNSAPPAAAANAPQRVGGSGHSASGPTMFNVPPESTRQLKVDTVCLDYGHPTPRPAIKYDIQPISAATDKAGVAEVCELLGRREISHRAAQLAAWHLSNDMSWPALAALRTRQAIGSTPSYTQEELLAAKKAVEKALAMHRQRQSTAAPPQTLAASSAK
jgi:hypothetical protein